jgi:hypothetical protein
VSESVTVQGFSDDENGTLNLLLARLSAKEERNRLRAAYYDMRHAPRLVGSVIPPQYWKLGIVLGWSAKAVDALARRCNLDTFVWPDGDLNSLGFRELFEENRLTSETNQGLISSLIHATAFVVNTRGIEDEPDALIHFKDAMNATGTWNSRRRRLDDLLSVTARGTDGSDKDKPTEIALYLDGLTLLAEKQSGRWVETDRQEHSWGVPAEPLVYKPRLGRSFGSSRISRAVMGLQDMACRQVIRLEAHSDIYAIPDLWMFGADESIFKNADGSQKSSWQIVMGRIKGIPDDDGQTDPQLARADVKQIPASSPAPQLATLNAHAKLFARETSLPDSAVAITDVANPTSAESYDASQYELIAESEGAIDDWRPALRRAVIRGLAMRNDIAAGDLPPSWLTIDAKFRDPRYLTRSAEADAGLKQLTAAPELIGTELGYQLLGLDDQQVKQAMADQRRKAGSRTLSQIAADLTNGNPGA